MMNVDIDFLEKKVLLTFEQLNKIKEEHETKGCNLGGKLALDRMAEIERRAKPRKPTTIVPPAQPKKPESKPSLPDNASNMLEQMFTGKDPMFEVVLKQARKEAYKEGHIQGLINKGEGKSPEFDPELHVDNSFYGYTSDFYIENYQKGRGMTFFRNKDKWAKPDESKFYKITPLEGDKK